MDFYTLTRKGYTESTAQFTAVTERGALGQAIKVQSLASGVGAFTNEFMTGCAAQCHLSIGMRCSI
jgi:hypothetical protein